MYTNAYDEGYEVARKNALVAEEMAAKSEGRVAKLLEVLQKVEPKAAEEMKAEFSRSENDEA